MRTRLKAFSRAVTLVSVLLFCCAAAGEEEASPLQLRALLITGQSNHNWHVSAPILETILEDSGIFLVDLVRTPPTGRDMSDFMPQFAAYDVVVLKYTGDAWPQETQVAFVDYVANGGGVVVVHESNNAFPDWPEYNEIIGLGGWGGRNEEHGPYVYWRDDRVMYDTTPGPGGAHGRQHSFEIIHRQPEHPITRGLPERWQHTEDELYHHLRGPARNMTILATAYSDPDTGGTGEHEPILFTVAYEQGRMFQTALGHAGPSPEASPAHQCAGFIVTLQRGAEWAATGAVTQPVPADFPEENTIRIRPRFQQDSITPLMEELAAYQYNDSLAPLVLLEELTRKRTGAGDPVDDLEEAYIALLQSENATYDARLFACKQLALIGGRNAVPVLSEMLLDFDLAYMARYALERIPGRHSLDALREALPMVGPEHRAGIINSLGVRGDRQSIPPISAALHDGDERVATAALRALAAIGQTESAAALLAVIALKEGDMKSLAETSYIQSGFTLLEQHNRSAAAEVFSTAYELMKDDAGKRAAALRGKIAAASARDKGAVIIEALRGDDVDMRAVAAAAVRDISRQTCLSAIAALLPELDEHIQVLLLTALSETPVSRITPVLMETAQSESEAVRIAALRALAVIGDAEATGFLLAQAAAATGQEQDAARYSLSRLPGANRNLIAALREEEDPALREEVLKAVAARRIGGATPILLEQLPDTTPEERVYILDVLTQIAEPEQLEMILPLLLSAEEQDAGNEMADMVAVVADRAEAGAARIEALAAALETETEASARRNIYVALGKIADDAALEALEAGLQEENATVRMAAVEALAAWPTDTPLEMLKNVIEKFSGDQEGAVALSGYVRLVGLNEDRSPEEAAAMYEAALSFAQSAEEKKNCITAIGSTGADATLPLLYDALADEEIEVARAAVNALGAWPNAVPMARLEMLAKDGPDALKTDALRGYFRLIGLNDELSEAEAAQRYREALTLAHNDAERKRILSGLAGAETLAALQVVTEYLDDPDLRNEAGVAAFRIAETVIENYPDDVSAILDKVEATVERGFVRDGIEKTREMLNKFQGYITAWEVAGPYTVEGNDLKDLFDTPFAPEIEDEKDAVAWRRIPVGTNASMPYLVELDKALGRNRRAAYLRTNVWSDAAREARLEIGSDDGNKVWLNGALVNESHATRAVAPAQEIVEIELNEGWNPLLVKVTQDSGEWSACLRIRSTDGAPLEDVRASVDAD